MSGGSAPITPKNQRPEFIAEIGARTLLERGHDDLIVEHPCLEILQMSEVIEKISIIDGTVPGLITKALDGETVGTVIYRE